MSDSGGIRAIHIGGRGTMGPVGKMFALGSDFHVTIIEADLSSSQWGTFEKAAADLSSKLGIGVDIVPACISDRKGNTMFNVMADPRASSLYEMAPGAINMRRPSQARSKGTLTWADTCRTVQRVPIETTTLDTLWYEGKVELPNILSMDIQGAEYAALLGARQMLFTPDVLCVILEQEFGELYADQGMFHESHGLLLGHGFRFGGFEYLCEWFDGPMIGRGFLTVVESIYLRERHFVDEFLCRMKLATIAHQFGFLSFMYQIVQAEVDADLNRWENFIAENGYGPMLAEGYLQTKRRLEEAGLC